MRSCRLMTWCLLLGGSCALWAQEPKAVTAEQHSVRPASVSRESRGRMRLLDANDGLAIIGAALETRHAPTRHSDCSHLVHSIYEKAGFTYKYQSSSDLYAGDDEFQRVSQPQAGDVIVWPGHAGIVVNPAQHTFYSALRSGFGVQPYDSVYWKGRGRPRFLRYIKARPAPLTAARHVAGLKPTGMTRTPAVERTPLDSEKEGSPAGDPAVTLGAPITPTVITVKSRRPKSEQLSGALHEYFEAANRVTSMPSLSGTSIAAFDTLEVQKVHLQGDVGWAQIRFRGFDYLAGKNDRSEKHRDAQRFVLHRVGPDIWELTLPADPTYLPRDLAVRVLAHRLAILTDQGAADPAATDQQVELARWLDQLLERR